jgi:hypothetical protein
VGAAGDVLGAGLALALVEGLVELDARALHELLVLVRDGAGERWSVGIFRAEICGSGAIL